MKRIFAALLFIAMVFTSYSGKAERVLAITPNQASISNSSLDITSYSSNFEFKKIFRRPENHIGETYLISGRLCDPSFAKKEPNGGFVGLWLDLDEYTNTDEYIKLDIDALDFNLLENDWLDVYITITGVGPLGEYFEEHTVFYAHVDALIVYENKGGDILETYISEALNKAGKNALTAKVREVKQKKNEIDAKIDIARSQDERNALLLLWGLEDEKHIILDAAIYNIIRPGDRDMIDALLQMYAEERAAAEDAGDSLAFQSADIHLKMLNFITNVVDKSAYIQAPSDLLKDIENFIATLQQKLADPTLAAEQRSALQQQLDTANVFKVCIGPWLIPRAFSFA